MRPDSEAENNADSNGKQPKPGRKLGGVTGKGFMPGNSGNPKGRPRTKGLLNALRMAIAEVDENGVTVEERLVDSLITEALRGGNRLAAVQTIFDRLEGKPKQQLDFNDITRAMEGRTKEELLHFAEHGCWPEDGEADDTTQD